MIKLYTLGEEIHEGCRTLVYRGKRLADGLSVIIKRLRAEVATEAGELRLRREYELLAGLDLPGVVKVLDLEQDKNGTALVMEDIGGEDLDRLLGRTNLALTQFLVLACGLAETLAGLHRQGIIHKDINPGHIIYNRQTGEFRLIGFAIAEELPRRIVGMKPPAALEGTLEYMSPEQTGRMNRSLDYRTDFYSLGATFYRLLTDQPPFSADDALGMVHCHIARQPTPPRERIAAIPGPLSDIVMKLLAKTAEERYQTAEGLKADLERCAAKWQAQKSIEPFPLGMRDVPSLLLIPEKLYGRQREVETLLAAFDRVVASGKPELGLVSGYSGIGKSAVVNELHKALVPPRALFAGGKFDQYKRDIPYATLAQALQAIVRQVLGKNEEEITEWRESIQEAVGPNGRLVTDLVPDLVALIGEQQPIQDVPPQDSQNRFNTVFSRFLNVFARPGCPLVLFLDDLQWLDVATLQLLEHLLIHPAVKHILLLGAYRDNEVGPSHPLKLALDSMHKGGAAVQSVVLGPLTNEDVRRLTADAFHCEDERAEPLARLVYEKTGGNPFFTIQFLTTLADEGLVVFDGRAARWQWDLGRIRGKGFTDNVADLMIGKLNRLQAETREGLKQLASLGSKERLATLALVREITEEEVEKNLLEAIQAGFLLRQDDSVSFLHDRVQEAAYALIQEEDRPKVHLNIGRKLLSHVEPELLNDILFDVANHLNRGAGLMTDPAEKTRLVELNAAAGRRARASIAYATARDFFATAAALLPEGTWDTRYDFKFALYLDWAECEYLRGAFDEAEPLFDLLLAQAKSALDQAKVYDLRLTLYQVGGKYDDALAAGLHALQLLGVEIPEDDPGINREIQAEAAAAANWRGCRIAELASVPAASDPRIKAVIAFLTSSCAPAYIGSRPQLFPLLNLKTVNYSLRFGPTKESSHAYAAYGFMLVSVFGDPQTGYAFSDMAIKLSQRFNDLGTIGAVLYLHGNHVNFWINPIATDFPILERGFRVCLDAGNLVFANYIAYSIVWQAVERGDRLGDILGFSQKYASFALGSRNEAIYQSIVLEQQFLKCLMGETEGSASFSDDGVSELSCVEKIANASFTCGVMYYHTMKTMAAYLMGDDAASRTNAEEAGKILTAAMAQPMEAMFYFLHALVLTRACREAAEEDRGEILKTLASYQKKLAFWSENCPANFASKHALVSAEIAEIEGNEISAERLFEHAIESARTNGFIHWEAMANEAAGRFHGNRGLKTASLAYLREARSCYARWDADAKVKQLEALHPLLAEEASVERCAFAARTEQLDVMAILKAQQAISGEIIQERLVETLLRIIVENAGAQKGYLFVEPDSELFAVDSADGQIEFHRAPSPSFPSVAESILNYVKRTGRSVFLADASMDAGGFANDEHLLLTRPKSVLCLPILRQAKRLGAVYLENNLVAGAFTPERRLILEVLATQAAISLETAGLYEALQTSEERLRLTLEATKIATWDWDVQNDRWTASPVYYTMLGYEPQTGPADREEWMTRLHPDERALFNEKMEDVLTRNLDDYQYEARLLHADGTYSWQFVKGFGIKRDPDGRVTRMLGIRMDIHERKQAEEDLHRLKDELELRVKERTVELEKKNAELERMNQLFVGRELRMVELKKRIKDLEGQLDKSTAATVNVRQGAHEHHGEQTHRGE